jgi:hypothetical protein
MKQFLSYHKTRPIMVELPHKQGDNLLPVYLTEKNVIDEFGNECYLVIQVKDIDKYKDYTKKMLEHYIYDYFKFYLKFFLFEGDLYLKYEYL